MKVNTGCVCVHNHNCMHIPTNAHTHTQWNEMESDLLLLCASVIAVQKHTAGPFCAAVTPLQPLSPKQSSTCFTL